MTALTWLALAFAVALMPATTPALRRAGALAAAGRLAPGVPRSRRARDGHRSQYGAAVRVWVSAGAVTASAAVTASGGPLLGAACLAAVAAAAALAGDAVRRRNDSAARAAANGALRLLVAELRAGSSPADSLDAAARAAPLHAAALSAAAAAARSGDPVAAALDPAGVHLAPLAHAWRVAAGSGAPVADLLERARADLNARTEAEQELRIALAGPRSSALLLAGLPALGVLLAAASGARPLGWLLGNPSGRLVCAVGVLLDAAGVLWTRQLLRRAGDRS